MGTLPHGRPTGTRANFGLAGGGPAVIFMVNMLSLQTLRSSRAVSLRSLHAACRVGFLALALLGLVVTHASAGPTKGKEKEFVQTNDEIASVDTKAKTVTVATVSKQVPVRAGAVLKDDGAHTTKTVTYTVIATTEIEVNGQKSDINGLQKGMKISVTKGTDETVAARLVAH